MELFEIYGTIKGDAKGLDEAIAKSRENAKKLKDDLDGLDKVKIGGGASAGLSDTEKAANKASQMIIRLDNQIAKLSGNNSELDKLNRLLSQNGIAAKIDETTKAILRQKAQSVDALRDIQNANKSSSGFGKDLFGTIFGATTLSGLAVNGISAAVGEVKSLVSEAVGLGEESVRLAANLQDSTNALTVFTGSTRLAKEELKLIDDTARNTVGLRLESAEQGFTRLRALGFEAETSRRLIAGLGKERILSGANEQDINRVIVNLTQLSAGSGRASQDIKEMTHAMPALTSAFADAFGSTDPKVIQKFFAANPDKAIEKFAASLEKTQAPAGGLNNAIEKITDSFIEAERIFGEPIVDPLTDDIKELQKLLTDNKAVWADWGSFIANIVKGLGDDLKEFNIPTPTRRNYQGETVKDRGVVGNVAADELTRLERIVGFLISNGGGAVGGVLKAQERGAEISKRQEEAGRQLSQQFPNFKKENLVRSDNGYIVDFQALSEKEKEIRTKALADQTKAAREKERLTKEEIEFLTASSKETVDILKNRFAVEKALRDSAVRYTTQDELEFTRREGAARRGEISAQINERAGFYNKLIALNAGNDDEIEKLTRERNIALGDLNTELQLNEIETQKKIAAAERKIIDERRQALISFKQLQIQQSDFNFGSQSFDINRAIGEQVDEETVGFARLRALTIDHYNEISRISLESYQLQLQNLSLTKEQRLNLTTQMYLSEQKIAEDSRRALIEISDRQNQALIQRLEQYRLQASQIYKSVGEGFASAQTAFFNPDTFSGKTLPSLQNSLLHKPEQNRLNEQIELARRQQDAIRASSNAITDSAPRSSSGDSQLTAEQTAQLARLTDSLNKARDAEFAYRTELENIEKSVPGAYLEFERLAKLIGQGYTGAFDEAAKKSLEYQQILERADLSNEIDSIRDRIALETDLSKKRELQFQLGQAQRAQEKLGIDQLTKSTELYRNSLTGLNERLSKLHSRDTAEETGVRYTAQKEIAAEQVAVAEQIIRLEEQIAHAGENSADRYRAAWLKAILGVKEADISAVESQIASRARLDDQLTVHGEQIKAKTLEVLASQKSITEIFSDAQTGAINDAFSGVDSGVHRLAESLGIADTAAGHFFETMLGGLAKLALNQIFKKLFDPESKIGAVGGEVFGIPINLGTNAKKADATGADAGASAAVKIAAGATANISAVARASGKTADALDETTGNLTVLDKAIAKLAASCTTAGDACGCGNKAHAVETQPEAQHQSIWGRILGYAIQAAGTVLGSANFGGGSNLKPGGTIGLGTNGRANGGPVEANTAYIVGEREAEVFIPRSSGTVFNQEQLAKMGVGQKAPINQTFNFAFYPDPKTGAFSKESAMQVQKRIAASTEEARLRS